MLRPQLTKDLQFYGGDRKPINIYIYTYLTNACILGVTSFIFCNTMYPIKQEAWPIFSNLRKIGDKLVRTKSHIDFLSKCNDRSYIAEGFKYKCALNCGNKEIFNSIQNKLDKVNKESQNEYTQWLKKELCDTQKDFQRNKAELSQQLG